MCLEASPESDAGRDCFEERCPQGRMCVSMFGRPPYHCVDMRKYSNYMMYY